ncbi:MAG: glycosyltransferase, partial [Collinsella intestinalis]
DYRRFRSSCYPRGGRMYPTIVIPSYWAGESADLESPGAYGHASEVGSARPELDRCLASLEQVRNIGRIIVLLVCPQQLTERIAERVHGIIEDHPSLEVTLVTNREASVIMDRVAAIAPKVRGEGVSLRGYGAIRNMGLVCAAILGHDAVVFLDDDEVVLAPDFLEKALYGLGHETRQRLPILAKSGYFYNEAGSPLADTTKKNGLTNRWWTKRIEFNRWMERALSGTRISRSNYVCGGCFAVHARAFRRVSFDPFITRGEDLDFLFNMRLAGMDVWFDNAWVVKHLPPHQAEYAPRFMQNVYRWYYERAKLMPRADPTSHGHGRLAHALSGSVDLGWAGRPRAQDRAGPRPVHPRASRILARLSPWDRRGARACARASR